MSHNHIHVSISEATKLLVGFRTGLIEGGFEIPTAEMIAARAAEEIFRRGTVQVDGMWKA